MLTLYKEDKYLLGGNLLVTYKSAEERNTIVYFVINIKEKKIMFYAKTQTELLLYLYDVCRTAEKRYWASKDREEAFNR